MLQYLKKKLFYHILYNPRTNWVNFVRRSKIRCLMKAKKLIHQVLNSKKFFVFLAKICYPLLNKRILSSFFDFSTSTGSLQVYCESLFDLSRFIILILRIKADSKIGSCSENAVCDVSGCHNLVYENNT